MIVLITGPSGAGKSTFVGKLMAKDSRLAFSVSTTTRPIREGEVDGRDYDFTDETEFLRLKDEGAFVEWARVHDNYYGTRRSQLEEMAAAGKIPVLDIDVQGGVQVIDIFGPELLSVFLFPPSWEELERRLVNRYSGGHRPQAGQRPGRSGARLPLSLLDRQRRRGRIGGSNAGRDPGRGVPSRGV